MKNKSNHVVQVRIYQRDVLKYVCSSEHDAFMYLLRVQPRSILAAITEEGWKVSVKSDESIYEWNENYYGL